MSHGRVFIFANPIAGRGRGAELARRLETGLSEHGYAAEVFLDRADAFDLARLGGTDPARAAIVVGGDGTLRGVAHHLFLEGHNGATGPANVAPFQGPPLLIVPLGTANLMGRHLGIRWNKTTLVAQVAAVLARNNVVSLDTGVVNGKLFLLMAGVGFDARVVHELDRLRRGPIRIANYITPTLLALANYDYPPLEVVVDGRTVAQGEPAVAFVGNLPEYGTGFPILPHARGDDGVLDVCVLPCRSRVDLVRLFVLAALGEHVNADGVVYVKGRHVRITSQGEEAPVQVDGDPAGHTPASIDLLPIRLPFIVP
jgi:YegS/Rv2252/BmrU family lipid kinase